jgi:uronate dehydrogenase
MKRILITGAAGQIGVALREGLRGNYPLIRLLDVAPLGNAEPGEEVITADIRNIAAMEKAMAGIAPARRWNRPGTRCCR